MAKCKCPPWLPGYMGTFADLMSLLMCFFVLLLSFAEMDVQKFKRIAGSMEKAFGCRTSWRSRISPRNLGHRPGVSSWSPRTDAY